MKKIPSMHICIKWVHELLAVPDLSKRLFAIVLIAELAEQVNTFIYILLQKILLHFFDLKIVHKNGFFP